MRTTYQADCPPDTYGSAYAEVDNIRKIFETPPDASGAGQRLTALDGVTLSFSSGEIHAILGENGAGKSTLAHILSGLHQPTEGCIRIRGRRFCFTSPSDALAAGIAMVHQRPLLSDELTVLDNIILGTTNLFLNRNRQKKEIATIAAAWHIPLNFSARVGTLNETDRFRTALLAALYQKPSFLILDEPTAVFMADEKDDFFSALREMKNTGPGIILITHKLDEALALADRISVLRNGKLVFTAPVRNPTSGICITAETLAGYLDPEGILKETARKTVVIQNQHESKNKDMPFLSVSGISVRIRGRNPLHEVSFSVHGGSITGIFGLPGSGIETLEGVLSGMLQPATGTITICTPQRRPLQGNPEASEKIRILYPRMLNPAILRKHGIGIVPSDRTFRASHPDLTIYDMLITDSSCRFFPDVTINNRTVRKILEDEEIDASPFRSVRTLSGGQLQRLILARELARRPGILILAEPERGLDISSVARLRSRLLDAQAAGTAVIILEDHIPEKRFVTGDAGIRAHMIHTVRHEEHICDTNFWSEIRYLKEGRLI